MNDTKATTSDDFHYDWIVVGSGFGGSVGRLVKMTPVSTHPGEEPCGSW
jgi:hypothetical protein